MNQNAISPAILRQIIAQVRCRECRRHFALSDARVLGQRGNVWAISFTCRECRAQALVLASLGASVAYTAQTDLTPAEWDRFKPFAPVTTNEVIDFYRAMEVYTGDLSEIMDEPLPKE